MSQRWSWLNLEEALSHKPERERVLYRHFVPIYLHYQGEYLRANWEGDAELCFDRAQVVQAVVQAFIDIHQQHQLTLDESVLNRYHIDPALPEGERVQVKHQSYDTAFAIYEDCLAGRDPQRELAPPKMGWFHHLQSSALNAGRRLLG